MPLYDFKCCKCRQITEKLTTSDTKIIECPHCGYTAHRELAAPGGFQLKGDGFYKPSVTGNE